MTARRIPQEPIEGNRALWDELTPIHLASAFYDVEGFKAGRSSLRPVERAELGSVAGRSLLHLQCHFGLDTLSWARLGATVTGVDLSPRSVEAARRLATEVGIDATFVCASVYDLPAAIDSTFDIVYTSYGSLPWLPDIARWAEVVARLVAPQGIAYVVEFHPVVEGFGDGAEPNFASPYFYDLEPLQWQEHGTYAEHGARVSQRSYQWHHPIGDVVNALVAAGLTIDFLHEHPACHERLRPWMVPDDDGWWRAPGDALPVLYSVQACRR